MGRRAERRRWVGMGGGRCRIECRMGGHGRARGNAQWRFCPASRLPIPPPSPIRDPASSHSQPQPSTLSPAIAAPPPLQDPPRRATRESTPRCHSVSGRQMTREDEPRRLIAPPSSGSRRGGWSFEPTAGDGQPAASAGGMGRRGTNRRGGTQTAPTPVHSTKEIISHRGRAGGGGGGHHGVAGG